MVTVATWTFDVPPGTPSRLAFVSFAQTVAVPPGTLKSAGAMLHE